jgi:hypothetical protein
LHRRTCRILPRLPCDARLAQGWAWPLSFSTPAFGYICAARASNAFLYFEFGPKFGSKILNIFIVLNGFGQLANALLA